MLLGDLTFNIINETYAVIMLIYAYLAYRVARKWWKEDMKRNEQQSAR